MLPPPTTTAISTPMAWTSPSWVARTWVAWPEMPNSSPGGEKASPESLSRTRRYTGPAPPSDWSAPVGSVTAAGLLSCPSATPALSVLAELEPGEPPDHHVLSHLRRHLRHQLGDGPLAALVSD